MLSTVPFRVRVGRGSGSVGLDTIQIDEGGQASLVRRTDGGREIATIGLSPGELDEIRDSIATHQLLSLRERFHGGVVDGTQWIIQIEQNGNSKIIYCDNDFPARVQGFVSDVDAVLRMEKRGLQWKPASAPTALDVEDKLWKAVETTAS